MSHTKEILMKFEAGERLTPAEKMFAHIKSDCCNAEIRYLDCEDCRKENKHCIYICTECGAEIQ